MKSLQYPLIATWFLHSSIHLSICAEWNVLFNPNQTLIEIDATQEFHLILSNLSSETIESINSNYVLKSQNPQVAVVDNPDEIEFSEVVDKIGTWEAHFRVRGVFLGLLGLNGLSKNEAKYLLHYLCNVALCVIAEQHLQSQEHLFASTTALTYRIEFTLHFWVHKILENMTHIFHNTNHSFLTKGSTQFLVEKLENGGQLVEQSNEFLDVIVLRPERLVDTVFGVIVVLLLAISFINFGAAIDVETMKQIYKRPISPTIGTICQLICMPLLGYGLGTAIFPDQPELALGIFLTGISPAGGASNIWTLLCGGNINLSISMTTISTIACFGTMPLWLFLLGKKVFDRANIGVPYMQVTLLAISLVIPLAVGLLIQKFLPRVAAFLVRIIKIMSLIFILFIVIFGIVTNLYLMPLFAWQIVVAGLSLPLLGNVIGLIGGKVFKQPNEDCIAIAIEVGVQNTALTMFLLTFALEPPASHMSMIIPVAIFILTPVPMIIFIIVKKIREYLAKRKALKISTSSPEAQKVPI